MSEWFTVDKKGLALHQEGKHKVFIIHELLQNAWDTDATEVEVEMVRQPNSPFVEITVRDNDPVGFNNIQHAYTMFAESEKKTDPTKRGRFNVGEKMVFAMSRNARVRTMSGAVIFAEGERFQERKRKGDKTEIGSEVWAEVRMSREEEAEVREQAFWVIPPIKTVLFGEVHVAPPMVTKATDITMSTQADTRGDGVMRTTKRQTDLHIYEPQQGEEPRIYEMGIPVVEMPDDRFSVDVQQKVPTNVDRDNVTPSFKIALRGEILNATHDILSEEDSHGTWITEAMEYDDVTTSAIDTTMTKRYGKKRATFNPADPEANAGAVVGGYKVIHPAAFSGKGWTNIRATGSTLPSTKVAGGRFESLQHKLKDATPTEMRLRKDEWTPEMKEVVCLAQRMFTHREVNLGEIDIVRHPKNKGGHYAALVQGGALTFNLSTITKNNWDLREPRVLKYMISIISHEMAHVADKSDCGCGHFNPRFRDHMENSIGIFTVLALDDPDFFKPVITDDGLRHASYRVPR